MPRALFRRARGSTRAYRARAAARHGHDGVMLASARAPPLYALTVTDVVMAVHTLMPHALRASIVCYRCARCHGAAVLRVTICERRLSPLMRYARYVAEDATPAAMMFAAPASAAPTLNALAKKAMRVRVAICRHNAIVRARHYVTRFSAPARHYAPYAAVKIKERDTRAACATYIAVLHCVAG